MGPQRATVQRGFTRHFTNFSEISYKKTGSSYAQSEIAGKKQPFLAAH